MKAVNQPHWKKTEYSRTQVIKAGTIIKDDNAPADQLKEATKVIDNWRAAHAYPLHVMYIHLRSMAANRAGIVVAERLKRLDSIINKLKREPSMSLWTMQDIGGCRYIVPTVADVYNSMKKYKESRIRHKFKNMFDYIAKPKESGYRSLHLVYQYHSDSKEDYNKNMLIELQFRTHLQHVWATAVETMGLFTKQALKAGQGDADTKRFFAIASSLFALREGTPIVPGTIDDSKELISELEEINDRQHYLDMLSAIRVAVDQQTDTKRNDNGYYILVLNYNTRRLHIKHFKISQTVEANQIYSQIESTRAESQIDAVLVRVSSFQVLKAAYPNYFSDIGEFVNTLKSYLA